MHSTLGYVFADLKIIKWVLRSLYDPNLFEFETTLAIVCNDLKRFQYNRPCVFRFGSILILAMYEKALP